jgi:hypothetical protein
MNTDDLNDAELDAFLKGEDDLARRLNGVPQPSPSAELDAAILKGAAAALAPAARPQAANDPAAGRQAHPRVLSARWRVPAGIAATVLVGVLAHQNWQARTDMENAAIAPAAPQPLSQEKSGEAAAPSLNQEERLQERLQARPEARAPQLAVGEHPKQRQAAHPQASAPAPGGGLAAPSLDAAVEAPPVAAPSAVPPALPAEPELAAKPTLRSALPPARSSAKPGAPPPAPAASAVGPAPAVTKAEAWIGVIDEMLKAGLQRDALEEWAKFRTAYPDYPVPDELWERISAARK